jgi:hypothetical protein
MIDPTAEVAFSIELGAPMAEAGWTVVVSWTITSGGQPLSPDLLRRLTCRVRCYAHPYWYEVVSPYDKVQEVPAEQGVCEFYNVPGRAQWPWGGYMDVRTITVSIEVVDEASGQVLARDSKDIYLEDSTYRTG